MLPAACPALLHKSSSAQNVIYILGSPLAGCLVRLDQCSKADGGTVRHLRAKPRLAVMVPYPHLICSE
jgi:hypothetical protein